MADQIGELGLDVTAFNAGIDKVINKLDELNRATTKTNQEVVGLSGAFQKFIGLFSIGAITAFTQSLLNMGSAINSQAQSINLDAEAFQELTYAFSQNGAKAEDVVSAFSRLNVSLQEARDGNLKTIQSFERLGITWKNIATNTPDEIMMKIADGAADATDKVQAFDAVMDLLGKTGRQLIPTLKEGADEIQNLRDQSTKLTNEQIEQLDRIGQAWTNLTTTVKNYGAEALLAMTRTIPVLGNFLDATGILPPPSTVGSKLEEKFNGAPSEIPEDPREVKRREDIEAADFKELQRRSDQAEKDRQRDQNRSNQNKERTRQILGDVNAKELARSGQSLAARRESIRNEYERRILNELRKGNEAGAEALRAEQAIDEEGIDAAEGRQTSSDRRAERNAAEQFRRDVRSSEKRNRDLDDREARGARSRAIDERREQRQRDYDRETFMGEAEKQARDEGDGYGRTDRDILRNIETALKNKS